MLKIANELLQLISRKITFAIGQNINLKCLILNKNELQ